MFLLVGILGFIPGATTEYDGMTFAGHESTAMLLGIFHVSILHNIVHLLFGVVGLVLARTAAGATSFLIGGGVVYLVLWSYGLVIDHDSAANFVPVNGADNWLHLILAIAMIGWAWSCAARRPPAGPPGGRGQMGLMRTGAVIVAGAMIGQAVARRVARHEDGSGERSRWLAVTVNAPPEKVEERLADAVAELDVEVRVTAAPGGRGTEVAARPHDAQVDSRRCAGAVRDPPRGW